jgi:signal transduction histidine kinase
MLSQIFDRNSSASREGTEKEGTIGIGLSITRSIVEGHHGSIRVESIPNSGSTFYIELPILDTNDAVLTF